MQKHLWISHFFMQTKNRRIQTCKCTCRTWKSPLSLKAPLTPFLNSFQLKLTSYLLASISCIQNFKHISAFPSYCNSSHIPYHWFCIHFFTYIPLFFFVYLPFSLWKLLSFFISYSPEVHINVSRCGFCRNHWAGLSEEIYLYVHIERYP